MKSPLLYLICAVLLGLVSCEHRHEIDHRPSTTEPKVSNPPAEPKDKPTGNSTGETTGNTPAEPKDKPTAESTPKLVEIPDPQFRAYLKKTIPTAFEGDKLKVDDEKVKSLRVINVYNDGIKGIKSLKGIEYFTGLINLTCSHNEKLNSLDVSANRNLKILICSGNSFTRLDLSKNTNLVLLEIQSNKRQLVGGLDLSKNEKLTYLTCGYDQLGSLDLSKNKQLKELSCNSNQLGSLDLSKNKRLTILTCSDNKLDKLDLSTTKSLRYLSCSDNQLNSLDLSENANLRYVNYCENAKLISDPKRIQRGILKPIQSCLWYPNEKTKD